MNRKSMHISIDDDLAVVVARRVRQSDRFQDPDDYIRSLIERDAESEEEARAWLERELAPGLAAPEEEFALVSAEDVIRRNRGSRAG